MEQRTRRTWKVGYDKHAGVIERGRGRKQREGKRVKKGRKGERNERKKS